MEDQPIYGDKPVTEEIERCKSISYFARNYIKPKDMDGNLREWSESELDLFKLIDQASEHGGRIEMIKGRRGLKFVIVKD